MIRDSSGLLCTFFSYCFFFSLFLCFFDLNVWSYLSVISLLCDISTLFFYNFLISAVILHPPASYFRLTSMLVFVLINIFFASLSSMIFIYPEAPTCSYLHFQSLGMHALIFHPLIFFPHMYLFLVSYSSFTYVPFFSFSVHLLTPKIGFLALRHLAHQAHRPFLGPIITISASCHPSFSPSSEICR